MQSLYTTPIAYITTILKDPFVENVGTYYNRSTGMLFNPDMEQIYMYDTYDAGSRFSMINKPNRQMAVTWALGSRGPSRMLYFGNNNQMGSGLSGDFDIQDYRGTPGNIKSQFPSMFYDPTNGTMSLGVIVRTNKGVDSSGIHVVYPEP